MLEQGIIQLTTNCLEAACGRHSNNYFNYNKRIKAKIKDESNSGGKMQKGKEDECSAADDCIEGGPA